MAAVGTTTTGVTCNHSVRVQTILCARAVTARERVKIWQCHSLSDASTRLDRNTGQEEGHSCSVSQCCNQFRYTSVSPIV